MEPLHSFYFEDLTVGNNGDGTSPAQIYIRKQPPEEREREIKKKARIQAYRLNKTKNRHHTALLLLSLLITANFFVAYVHIQNRITNSMEHISRLEQQIGDLKVENSVAKSRIATAANLITIQKTAKKDLGMVYANDDHIINYSINHDDFMSRYDEMQ